MVDQKNILLICGGGGQEHSVSLKSAKYIFERLQELPYRTHWITINQNYEYFDQNNNQCILTLDGFLSYKGKDPIKLDFAIPCIHGDLGETGDIQSLFKIMKLPFLGADAEASIHCFNKITTKLWLEKAGLPVVPYFPILNQKIIPKKELDLFFDTHKKVFVKASNQGSSVGCYLVENKNELMDKINEAFKFSEYVLVEQAITGRELEISFYQNKGNSFATAPGEIITGGKFYDYDEKYSTKSKTKTYVEAENISEKTVEEMKIAALRAGELFKINHMARVDFFVTENTFYINEINTFPGHTSISMFPLMMEHNGLKYSDYLKAIIEENI